MAQARLLGASRAAEAARRRRPRASRRDVARHEQPAWIARADQWRDHRGRAHRGDPLLRPTKPAKNTPCRPDIRRWRSMRAPRTRRGKRAGSALTRIGRGHRWTDRIHPTRCSGMAAGRIRAGVRAWRSRRRFCTRRPRRTIWTWQGVGCEVWAAVLGSVRATLPRRRAVRGARWACWKTRARDGGGGRRLASAPSRPNTSLEPVYPRRHTHGPGDCP